MKLSAVIAALQAQQKQLGDVELDSGLTALSVHIEAGVFRGLRVDYKCGKTVIIDGAHLGDDEGQVVLYDTEEWDSKNGADVVSFFNVN